MEVPFKGFRSVNNQDASFTKEFTDLERGHNVDLDNRARLRRRGGTTERFTGDTHSAFAVDEMALYRQSTVLYRLKDDLTGGTAIKTGLTAGARMHYMQIPPGRVFMSDGLFAGATDGAEVRQWGITPPAEQPIAAVTSGRLPKGRYQYAVTFLRDDGEPSGTPRAGTIELTAQGGIAFTGIPVSGNPDVTHKVLWLTRPGGKDLHKAMRILNAATSAKYTGDALDLDVRLETQFLGPPPLLGTVLAWHHGRALMGAGAFLQYSRHWRPELFHPDDYVGFTSVVRFAAPVSGGVWVGTASEVAFLRGEDIQGSTYELKKKAAAIRGSVAYVNGSLVLKGLTGVVPIFATESGMHAGTEDGQLVDITEEFYRIAGATQGAATHRLVGDSTDGEIDQYLVILR